MKKTVVLLTAIFIAGTMCASATLIAGWESWTWQGAPTNAMISQASYGSGSATQDGQWAVGSGAASTDGTFGSLSSPAASTNNAANADGINLNSGLNGYFDFTITASGVETILTTFHFDAAPKVRDDVGATNWTLEVLSGDITTGVVDSGILPAWGGTAGVMTDVDVDLTTLTDHNLGAGGTATFRLSFSGNAAGFGRQTYLDNVGVSASADPAIETESLLADADDAQARYNWSAENTNAPYITQFGAAGKTEFIVGRTGSGSVFHDAAVYPFLLPTLPEGEQFTVASFSFGLITNTVPSAHVDLYGLDARASSQVLPGGTYSSDMGDWFMGQVNGQDEDQTTNTVVKLQDNILETNTAYGVVSTDADGGAALLDYLNAQYDNGAGAGTYVFLRLSLDDTPGYNKKYTVASSHNADTNLVPRIIYSTQSGEGTLSPPVLEVGPIGGDIGFTWSPDEFKVQSKQNLAIGDWTDVPGATNSPFVITPTNAVEFYRLIEQ